MIKIVRSSTIGLSLNVLLKGQLRFLSRYFEVIGVSGKGRDLEEVSRRESISTYGIDMERGISPLKDLIALFKLYRFLKKTKPTIIHSITPKAGLLNMLAGKLAGVPIRMHMYTGLIFPTKTGMIKQVLIKMDQLLCWAATNIYPEGKGVREDLIKYKITSKPLKILANGNVNGIDLKYFSSSQITIERRQQLQHELHLHPDDFVFLFVGRLVGDKGINEMVEAFRVFGRPVGGETKGAGGEEKWIKGNRVKLLLVGPLESDLDPLKTETLKEIESNPNIIAVGFQKDVRPYFAIADALVFPSYREGFPNVVMQAGAMGLPSIVSDINGCNEIIIEGENGTIIPVKDSEAIYRAMERFVNDERYYRSLKEKSREMIQDRYEQQVVWDALLKEYNTLLEERTKT